MDPKGASGGACVMLTFPGSGEFEAGFMATFFGFLEFASEVVVLFLGFCSLFAGVHVWVNVQDWREEADLLADGFGRVLEGIDFLLESFDPCELDVAYRAWRRRVVEDGMTAKGGRSGEE